MTPRILILPVMTAVAAVALAGCGGSSSSSSSKSAPPLVVKSASKHKVGDVLVNARGLTLYRNAAEKGGKIACTGSCAKLWPPLLAGDRSPKAGSGVTGELGTVKRPDGTVQVTDNGWPLYTYAKDTAPGQINGEGVGGTWFASSPTGGKLLPSSGGTGTGNGY
jgi:predicted lipoprotein with Yx(FWY)xxD motif